MAAAAAATGFDLEIIREAKLGGCNAFKSGRVYRKPLLEWLACHQQATDGPSLREVRRLLELEKLEKLRDQTAMRRGELLEEAPLAICLCDIFAGFNAALHRLPHTLPGLVVGKRDVHEVGQIVAGEVDAIIRALRADPFTLDAAQAAIGGEPIEGVKRGLWEKLVDYILREALLFFGRRFLANLPKPAFARVVEPAPADVDAAGNFSVPPSPSRRKRQAVKPAAPPADVEATTLPRTRAKR
jgi:hypothetical protein